MENLNKYINWSKFVFMDNSILRIYDNWCMRYYESFPWDTLWLVLYIINWIVSVENNPKLTSKQIENRLKKIYSFIEENEEKKD